MQRCVNRRVHAGEDTREIRDVEIFLTLAEGLRVGRTAERLHVSAARVSQAIKKQVRNVGAPSSSAPAEPYGSHQSANTFARTFGRSTKELRISMDRARSARSGEDRRAAHRHGRQQHDR
ncbi:helix-turn-helix domain-containing protein [Nonomuraea basaltis]|uniref:helix-turn-helix domain-containing protein n=1 Tax=Nonomuraea basaltis TaxID=2495887 RepID=UPI00197E69BF|nr:LysR family transcriptional regulator [Nonomuraea basaltis]